MLFGGQNVYNFYTRFAVVNTESPKFYNLSTKLAVVKTDYPNFYKPPIRFAVVKTHHIKKFTAKMDIYASQR